MSDTPFTPWDPSLVSEDDVARIYLAIISSPNPTRAMLIESGNATSLVDRVTVLLHSRGLLDASDPDHWEVPSPDIALTAWSTDVERRARAWRTSSVQLNQIYRDARRTGEPAFGYRQLSSLSDVASATASIVSGATEQVTALRANTRRTTQLLLDPFNTHREPFRNANDEEVDLLAVYDSSILQIDGALAALHDRTIGGEHVRLATFVPFSAVLVDDTAAVVEFSNIDPTGAGSMLLRNRPFVTALRRLAELWFASGMPLPGAEGSGEPEGMSDRDTVILQLLAGGASDTIITRRLRISQRTVERRVRHLMDQLGAQTRFQAGVEAARQGLL